MDYFVLQSQMKLKEGQNAFNLPGFRDSLNEPLGMLEPTAVSVVNRKLEWLVPNTSYNQNVAAINYHPFKILKAGEETMQVLAPEKMPGMPPPADPAASKKKAKLAMNPKKIKKLKAEFTKQLTGLGIEIPKNPTLQTLEKLLAEAEPSSPE